MIPAKRPEMIPSPMKKPVVADLLLRWRCLCPSLHERLHPSPSFLAALS
jgi:hypothetical protein